MGALDAAVRLNTSLADIAAALAVPNADALLGAEAGLAAALADLSRDLHATADERAALRTEVAKARSALARCRVLGTSLADAARLSLAAQGHGASYGRSGEAARDVAGARGHRVSARL